MLPWVYGSGPAPEALRGEDDEGVWNTAADHDVMTSLSGTDGPQQQQQVSQSLQPVSVESVSRVVAYSHATQLSCIQMPSV